MKFPLLSPWILAAAVFAPAAHASLVGHQVFGEAYFAANPTPNLFDPSKGYAPTDTLNYTSGTTVTISDSALEFGLVDPSNRDIANFTDSQLIISDLVKPDGTGSGAWTMRFTSIDPGLFTGWTLVSDTFLNGVTYALTGDTLSISWGGIQSASGGHDFQAVFARAEDPTSDVPEPASLALTLTGLLALVGGSARRRRR